MKNLLLITALILATFYSFAQTSIKIAEEGQDILNDYNFEVEKEFNVNLPIFEPFLLTRKTSYNNRLGLGGDATFFNITSDDIDVTQGTGFSVNFETRGDFRDDFDLIYSLGIFNHNFSVNENITNDQIDMSLLGVEIKFLLAWKVAQSDYFSIEAGPAIQLNGELKIDNENRYEDSFTGGLDPIALKELQNTSPFNLNGVVGFSGGARSFRVTAHYHYSFLDALTGTDVIGSDIDGNFSFLSVGARLYF